MQFVNWVKLDVPLRIFKNIMRIVFLVSTCSTSLQNTCKILKLTVSTYQIIEIISIILHFCLSQVSFDMSEYTAEVDAVGTLRLLDAIKTCKFHHTVKFYQASTSELFGKVVETPQTETTPFYPRSPYGESRDSGF